MRQLLAIIILATVSTRRGDVTVTVTSGPEAPGGHGDRRDLGCPARADTMSGRAA